jgi:hypothetical protein
VGAAAYDTLDDWFTFERRERTWGNDAPGAFPDSAARGRCTAGETCRIYDQGLTNGDVVARAVNPFLTSASIYSTAVHTWAVAGEQACDAIAGANWTGTECQSTFVVAGLERLGDRVGNDNLLCEDGEICLYTPNVGAYQGHGPLVDKVTLSGGPCDGTVLVEHTTNGY